MAGLLKSVGQGPFGYSLDVAQDLPSTKGPDAFVAASVEEHNSHGETYVSTEAPTSNPKEFLELAMSMSPIG